jgi:hypothetical protein
MAARPAQMGQCAPARFGGGHRASGVGCDVAPSSSQVHGMLHGLRIGHCRQPMEPLGKVAWAGAYPKGGGEVSVIITDVGVLLQLRGGVRYGEPTEIWRRIYSASFSPSMVVVALFPLDSDKL